MASFSTVTLTGDNKIDSLFAGQYWSTPAITYSFPQTVTDTGKTDASPFSALSTAQKEAVESILAFVSKVTNLQFTEASGGAGDIRLYFYLDADNPTGRTVNFPGQTGTPTDGDVELGAYMKQADWVPGSYQYFTVMHELGHALGLKHPHDPAPLLNPDTPNIGAPEYDSIEYTTMSYRSFVGGSLGNYSLADGSYPGGLMLDDIAALQHLYGANYSSYLRTDTTYSFDPYQPVLFETKWDGGGNDTYDFENYATNLKIDLNPGAWSSTGSQLAVLDDTAGREVRAVGNVANAYLVDNDPRGLIENAIGGAGNDLITGNIADNRLEGGRGNDTLIGGDGNDTLAGGGTLVGNNNGDDVMTGGAGNDSFDVSGGGIDRITDFSLGDRIRTGTSLNGTMQAGDGSNVAARSVQYATAGDGSVTLYLDTDGAAGAADQTVKLTIVGFDASRLALQGGDIVIGPPPAPSAPTLDLGSDSGAKGDKRTSDDTPSVSGTGALAGAAIKLYDTGGTSLLGSATADAGGNWHIDSKQLTEGLHQLSVTQTDGYGMSSAASAPLALTVDRTPPSTTVSGLSLSNDSGASPSDLITNAAGQTLTLTLSAALATGDTVEGSVNGGATWTDLGGKTVGTTITWDGVSLDGSPVLIRLVDAAGNVGTPAVPSYVLDQTLPTDITLTAHTVISGSADGVAVGQLGAVDARTGDQFTYALADSGDARDDDNAGFRIENGILKAVSPGAWAGGGKHIVVRVTDTAGNSFDKAFTIDVLETAATLGAPGLDPDSDSGAKGDGITSDTTPTIRGNGAQPNSAIKLYDHGSVVLGETTAKADGSWHIELSTLAEGAHALTAIQTNSYGLSSEPGAPLSLTIDSQGPAAAVSGVAFSADSGASSTDLVTNVAQQTLTVTLSAPLAAGDRIEGSLDGGAHWTDLGAKVTGTTLSWTGVTLDAAQQQLMLRLLDQAGNAGDTVTRSFVLDTAAPTDITLSGHQLMSGSAAGTVVGVLGALDPRADDSFRYALVDSGDGRSADNAGFRIADGKLEALNPEQWQIGSKHIVVRVLDAAGNSYDKALTIDVLPPASAVEVETSVIGGVAVRYETTTRADGTTTQYVQIPAGSQSVSGEPVKVPLVGADGAPLLEVVVPAGAGLQVMGPSGPLAASVAAPNLLAELAVRASGSLPGMQDGFADYLKSLPPNVPLLVQTILPTGTAAAGPLAISSSAAVPAALVIDAHGLAAGAQLQLDDVGFVAVLGDIKLSGGAGKQLAWGDSGAQTIVLGAGDDTLHGGGGNDTVGGGEGSDHVYGDDGNDLVSGGDGNDIIDGGSGVDVLQLRAHSRADYQFRVQDGVLLVTQRTNSGAGGSDGADLVSNVEAIRFGADSSAAGSIGRLFETLFGHAADAATVQSWADAAAHGTSLHEIAAALLATPEAQRAWAGLGSAQFVDALYQAALHRSADTAGAAYWSGLLDKGVLDRAGLLLALTDSAEGLQTDGAAGELLDFNHSDVAAIVRLYDSVFGRTPDEAGLNYWIAASESGASLGVIASSLLGSSEGQQRYGVLDNAHFAATLLEATTRHEGGNAELADWTGKLDSGALSRADLLLTLSESQQHVTLVGTVTTSIGHA
jgi:serralysin